jgi:hypothetical protein
MRHPERARPDREAPARPAREPDGGDAACWAALVCPECGGLADGLPTTACRRCGAPFPGG